MFVISDKFWRIKVTKDKGRAAFCKKEIPPGAIIGDYLGTIIRPKDADKKDALLGMWRNDKEVIWAEHKSLGVHLINHSCTPSAAFYPHKGHVLVVALRKILPGEEITVSYFIDPVPHRTVEEVYSCFCESEYCKGGMYVSKELSDKYETFIKKTQGALLNKQIVPYGKKLPPLKNYPVTLPDNVVYDLYGSLKEKPFISNDKKLPTNLEIRKLIRKTGRTINFKNIGIKVIGVIGNSLVVKSKS